MCPPNVNTKSPQDLWRLLDLLIPCYLLLLVPTAVLSYLSVMLRNGFHWLSGCDMDNHRTPLSHFLTLMHKVAAYIFDICTAVVS